jgi:RNA polymerase sigma-70 factor (sigma-E family)
VISVVQPDAVAGTDLVALYRAHYQPLVRLAAILLDDLASCEEVVQDAFVNVHLARGRVEDPAKLAAYLRSAVLNGARSQLRKRAVRRRVQPAPPDPSPPAEWSAVLRDDQAAVLEALRALPGRQRDVLVLRFYLDLSERDIAQTLGIAQGTVKTHTRRGLETLARRLEARR